ncbi:MAG: endolytic transglycosylase MltG, partial [Tannerella sp.]|nr:endolytic transglycosylase MltG [Tannerella sp.]
NKHLEVDSPYNTYLHAGLPHGPIRIPSPQAINAVLNYEHHNYLYMCAKEDFSGRHSFAVTSAEHYRNAQKIHNALDINGIR